MAGKTIAYLNVLLGASNRQLYSALDDSEKRLRRFGGNLQNIGKDLSLKVTAPLAAIGYTSVQAASTFSDSMLKVKALSGATGDDFDKLKKKALELGQNTRYSASEVADAMGYMALAGFNTNQTLKATPAILSLAAASQTDLAQTSDIVTDTMSAFGIEASNAMKISDLFAQTQAKSNTSVLQLGEAFKYVAPNFSAAGQSIEDTSSLLAVLANNGFKGSMAGTALNAFLKDLTGNAENGAIQVGNQAVAIYDSNGAMRSAIDIVAALETATAGMTQEQRNAALGALFEERSIRAVNIMLQQGSGELRKYQKELGNSAGAAQRMADEMESGLGGSLRKIKSNLEGVGIVIGDHLTPLIQSLANVIGSLTTSLNAMNPETQKTIVYLGVFAAAIPPILFGIGSMITMGTAMVAKLKLIAATFGLASIGATGFGAALSAAIWPITLTVGAIIGLVAAYKYLNSQTEINKRVTAEITQRLKYLNDIQTGAKKVNDELALSSGNLAQMSKEERVELIKTTEARILALRASIEEQKQLNNLTGKKAMELTTLEKMKAALFSFGNSAQHSYNLLKIAAEKYYEATKQGNDEIKKSEENLDALSSALGNVVSVINKLNETENNTGLKKTTEEIKQVFEELNKELKKVGILSDIIGKDYDYLEARIRAFTQAMLDLRVSGVEKTSSAYKELEENRVKALDSKEAIEQAKNIGVLTQKLRDLNVVSQVKVQIGSKTEKFDSSILGMDAKTFNDITQKSLEAQFEANMKIAAAKNEGYKQMLADRKVFNESYNSLVESFVVDMTGELLSGLAASLVQGKDGFNQFFSSILSNFGRFLVQMGKMGVVYSGFAAKIREAFINPAAGLAASFAMIAIGGAMTAYAGKIGSVVNGSRSSTSSYSSSTIGAGYAGLPQQSLVPDPQTVEFKISGDTLVGVLNNNNRFKSRF